MDSLFDLACREMPRLFSGSRHKSDVEELRKLFGLLRLNQGIEPAAVAVVFPSLWSKFLDLDAASKDLVFKDRPAQIAFLSALYQINNDFSDGVIAEYHKAGAWYERSIVELKLRLSGRLYKYARRIWRDFKNSGDVAACLDYLLEVSDLSPSELSTLKDASKRIFYGFRGASREIIGRTRETDFEFWQLAYDDMMRSYQMGNRSAEAKEFLRGIAVSRFVKHDAMDYYDDACRLFDEGFENDPQVVGEYIRILSSAAPRLAQTSKDAGYSAAEKGERLARNALRLPEVGQGQSQVPFFRQQRAFFSTIMLQNQADTPKEQIEETLNANIADFSAASSVGIGGANLPDALLKRAVLYAEQDRLKEARADLDRCQAAIENLVDPVVKANVGKRASSVQCRIEFCEQFAAGKYSDAINTVVESRGFLPYSYYNYIEYLKKMRAAVDSPLFQPSSKDTDLLREFLGIICTAPDEIEPPTAIEFTVSYAANLSRSLDGTQISELTLDLYQLASTLATENRMVSLSFAGNIFLQAGKQDTAIGENHTSTLFGEAVRLFEESIENFDAREDEYSEAFVPEVVFSKAAEAHLRFAKHLLPELSSYERAVVLFEKSIELGNFAPEIYGLMGDARYRIAVGKGSDTEFEAALALKATARDKGNLSRENFSVSARISERLFQLRGEVSWLSSALGLASEAIKSDPSWAWPYIQIWELMTQHRGAWNQIYDGATINDGLNADLCDRLARCDQNYVISEGVKQAVRSSEFQRKMLGGRSEVFTIDDPHGLLGTTVVLKPTTPQNADRETAEAAAVRKLIDVAGRNDDFAVIEPMSTTTVGENELVLAMRYAEGVTLAQRVLRARKLDQDVPVRDIQNAIEFLTLFHSASLDMERGFTMGRLRDFLKPVQEVVGRRRLEDAIGYLGFKVLPAVRKKDAHAENWIISSGGRVIMLDLEASRMQPVFADLSQLFDDYPTCSPTAAGWQTRAQLADAYLRGLGFEFGSERVLRPYLELFAIWRAAVMIPSLKRKQLKERSLSALKAYKVRSEHIVANMTFLREEAVSQEMAQLAGGVLNRLASRSS